MLKYYAVERVTVYKFLTPVLGAISSAMLLGENLFSLKITAALLLVSLGIVLVNQKER